MAFYFIRTNNYCRKSVSNHLVIDAFCDIKPIPNIQEKIQKMLAKYRAETIDIEDVEYEEADLEEDVLFSDDETESAKSQL